MDYSAEVRRRFDAALAAADRADGDGTHESIGEAEDRTLGVWVRARISVRDGHISAASFDVYGCPDTIAAARYVEERLCGAALAQLDDLDARGLIRVLGIPTEKLGKVLRLEDAVLAAVARAREQGQQESNNDDITD